MTVTEPIAVEELRPLEPRCEWTSESLGDGYVWPLTDDDTAEIDAAEIDAALTHARATVGETSVLSDDDKPEVFRLGRTSQSWWDAARKTTTAG
jgi:hypothetical protein